MAIDVPHGDSDRSVEDEARERMRSRTFAVLDALCAPLREEEAAGADHTVEIRAFVDMETGEVFLDRPSRQFVTEVKVFVIPHIAHPNNVIAPFIDRMEAVDQHGIIPPETRDDVKAWNARAEQGRETAIVPSASSDDDTIDLVPAVSVPAKADNIQSAPEKQEEALVAAQDTLDELARKVAYLDLLKDQDTCTAPIYYDPLSRRLTFIAPGTQSSIVMLTIRRSGNGLHISTTFDIERGKRRPSMLMTQALRQEIGAWNQAHEGHVIDDARAADPDLAKNVDTLRGSLESLVPSVPSEVQVYAPKFTDGIRYADIETFHLYADPATGVLSTEKSDQTSAHVVLTAASAGQRRIIHSSLPSTLSSAAQEMIQRTIAQCNMERPLPTAEELEQYRNVLSLMRGSKAPSSAPSENVATEQSGVRGLFRKLFQRKDKQ